MSRREHRRKITEFLGATLIDTRLTGLGKHFASEVTFDYGTQHPKRVDFVQFTPQSTVYVDGIEKGEFTCYEIKSCKEDMYSGNGINFFGEQNYFVMTMQTWKDLQEDFRSGKIKRYISSNFPESSNYWGVMVPVPLGKSAEDEYLETTPIDDINYVWDMRVIIPCRRGPRKRSMVEMLFCMLRSGK